MTYQEYAALPGIRASELKNILHSPAYYLHEKHFPEDTPALAFGRALHAFVLDPESFATDFLVIPEINKKSKAGQEEYGALIATGKQLVTEKDFETIKGMSLALMNHPDARRFLTNCETEQVRQWGPHKGRADMVGHRWLADLKSARDASPRGARSAMYRDLLHVQAAHYSEGWNTREFWFVFIEKKKPYLTGCYQITEAALDEGEILRQRGIKVKQECEETGVWPSYPTGKIGLSAEDEAEEEEDDDEDEEVDE